jgi:hypothetical protein
MLEIFSALTGIVIPALIAIGILGLAFIIWIVIPLIIEDPKTCIKSAVPFIWIASVIYYLVVYGSSMLTSASSFMGFLAIFLVELL